MTITVSPEIERRLRQQAADEGTSPDALAEAILALALDRDEADRQEAIEGIRRGLEQSAAGRVRPAETVFAEMRARLPSETP